MFLPTPKNWITHSDHIELRRGYARLGDTNVDGNGKVTGLGIGIKYDGTEIPFILTEEKLKYMIQLHQITLKLVQIHCL